MMHYSIPRLAIVLLGLGTLVGCNRSGETTLTVSTPVQKSTEELLTIIEQSVQKAQTTFETMKSSHREFRVEMLRKQITEGHAAIEELVTHADATAQQVDSARSADSALLYFGAVRLQPDYVEQLSACAERLMANHPDSEACRLALGRWLDFRYVSQDADFEDSLVTIADYARAYPQQPESVALFSRLSSRLTKGKQFEQAKQTLEVGAEVLSDTNTLKGARQFLAKSVRIDRQRAAARAAERQYRARIKSILGGRTRGYFVVYSEEPKTRRCDYSKCHGIKEVVAYAKDAEKQNWKWEFIISYPDTREGSIDATNKVTVLYRRNTTVSWSSN